MKNCKSYNKQPDPIATKDYYTRIKNDDPVIGGGNKYVQGVVMGIMTSVCEECVDDECLKWVARGTSKILVDKRTGDHIYCIRTSQERYDMFAIIVEKVYPGICEFDIYD